MVKYNKVLVTGGSGFVGKQLKKVKPDWIYISSKDYDLTDVSQTKQMFLDYPDLNAVIHLAGIVGGIKKNATHQADFFYKNVMMNTNVVHESYLAGVPRLLASLSTCAFPDVVSKYPFQEMDILSGPPAPTNFSYGYTKRMLYIQTKSYRKQYGVNYSCFCPSNIYGPGDDFNIETCHFVPSLIVKTLKSKRQLELWGTGQPLRQQLYIEDLCEIIPILLEKHNSDAPLIVSPNENLSIDEMAKTLLKSINKKVEIVYNKQLDGQFRKDGDNSELKKLIGDYNFTSFKEGVFRTYMWFVAQKLINSHGMIHF
jgi:GDP-L-fucose synthase